jgi:hypothetical protein
MRPGDANGPDSAFALRQEVAGLRAQLNERERAVSALTAMVERQIGMIERYDAAFNSPNFSGDATQSRMSGDAFDRTLNLLEQAVAGVEKRARDVAALEGQLDRALQLLDQSLRNQEVMVERGLQSNGSAVSPAVEETLAKYDRMLERSLAALESAYAATQTSRTEIGERDKLLSRTLTLLENTVEANGNGARKGLLGRLFA